MWKTITAIFLGKRARVELALEKENAALIIEQKIREAEAGHAAAKRGLAALIARSKAERKALNIVATRIADLTARTRAALDAGKEKLAADAAALLAELENEQTVRQRALTGAEEKSDRMRLAIEKTQRQLVDLQQGLITAKSIEAERNAIRHVKGDVAANSAIREGEAVLKRLLASEDPIEEIEALEELEADMSGDTIIDRLADAGFGEATRVRAEDILARFRNDTPDPAAA